MSVYRLAALFAVGWAFRHSGAAGALHTLGDLIAASPLKDAHAKLMKIVPVATWFLYVTAKRLVAWMTEVQHELTRQCADCLWRRSTQPGHVDARYGGHPWLFNVSLAITPNGPTVIGKLTMYFHPLLCMLRPAAASSASSSAWPTSSWRRSKGGGSRCAQPG